MLILNLKSRIYNNLNLRSAKPLFMMIVLTLSVMSVFAQTNSYGELLRLSGHAYTSALGGQIVGSRGDNVGLALSNPAQIYLESSSIATISQFYLPAQIRLNSAAFVGRITEKKLPFFVSLQYLNYGEYDAYNEFDQFLGVRDDVSDLDIKVGINHRLNESLVLGTSLGYLASSYSGFNSNALHADIGLLYHRDTSGWRIGLVAQNIGRQLKSFDSESEAIPFNLSIGFSTRLKHLPFTLHLTYHDLQQWDLEFDAPFREASGILFNNTNDDIRSRGFMTMFLRHWVIGGEFDFGQMDSFFLRFGFDINKNQIIAVPSTRTLAGFYAGIGLRIRNLIVDYSFGADHYVSNTHHIGLSLQLANFNNRGLVN